MTAAKTCIRKGRDVMAKSLYDFCLERDEFDFLVQWDKEKNSQLTPRDVAKGSHKKVWWKCAFGHHWQAAVYTRTGQGTGCPYCAGKMILPSAHTIASDFPQLALEWHPTKNFGLLAEDVLPGTHRKVWWKCSKGHEWQARVNSRAQGTGCPICANKKVLTGENDLCTTHPDLAAQWHPEKNGSLTPQTVVYGNHRKVWWFCDKGHEWQATIQSRTNTGSGCPVCASKVVIPGVNDLASQKPHIAAQWHPNKNGVLTPQNVTPYSNRYVWWVCDKGHEYRAAIAHRSQSESDCPYCKNRKVLAGFNDLATLEPRIAEQWHPELNGSLTPQMVTVGSAKRAWWRCADGHIWKAVIYSRTGSQKCGCPVCSGKVRESRQLRYADIVAEGLKNKK